MSTSTYIVSHTQYTQVSGSGLPVKVQASSVPIYVIVSDSQPSPSATGMTVNPRDWIEFSTPSAKVWAMARRSQPVNQPVFVTEDGQTTGAPTGKGDLAIDAWGTQKVVQDVTILHGMFTSGVPSDTWKESINGVEQAGFSNAASVDGELVLSSNGVLNDEVKLSTFRHPRYQPNRGHRYAISAFLPSPTAQGQRDFGLFTEYSGVFFRLKSDGNLYAVRRTTINAVTTDTEHLCTLPASFDLEKGNTYDI